MSIPRTHWLHTSVKQGIHLVVHGGNIRHAHLMIVFPIKASDHECNTRMADMSRFMNAQGPLPKWCRVLRRRAENLLIAMLDIRIEAMGPFLDDECRIQDERPDADDARARLIDCIWFAYRAMPRLAVKVRVRSQEPPPPDSQDSTSTPC